MIRLTVEEVKMAMGDDSNIILRDIAWKQIEDTMRHVESLKSEIDFLDAELKKTLRKNDQLLNLVEAFHHDTMYKDNPGLHDLAIELLSNKESVHE